MRKFVILNDAHILKTRNNEKIAMLLLISTQTQKKIINDLTTIYRPDIKWGPALVSKVLQTKWTSKFVTLSDMLRWQKKFINDVIMTVSWHSCNLKTNAKWESDLIFPVSAVLQTRLVGHQVYTIVFGIVRVTLLLQKYLQGLCQFIKHLFKKSTETNYLKYVFYRSIL